MATKLITCPICGNQHTQGVCDRCKFDSNLDLSLSDSLEQFDPEEVKANQEMIQAYKQAYENSLNRADPAEITRLNQEIGNLNQHIQELTTDNQQIPNLNNRIQYLENENQELNNLRGRVRELEAENQQIAGLNNRIRNFETSVAQYRNNEQILLNRNRQLQEAVNNNTRVTNRNNPDVIRNDRICLFLLGLTAALMSINICKFSYILALFNNNIFFAFLADLIIQVVLAGLAINAIYELKVRNEQIGNANTNRTFDFDCFIRYGISMLVAYGMILVKMKVFDHAVSIDSLANNHLYLTLFQCFIIAYCLYDLEDSSEIGYAMMAFTTLVVITLFKSILSALAAVFTSLSLLQCVLIGLGCVLLLIVPIVATVLYIDYM